MGNDKTAWEQLDRLLTELEEDILETENIVSTDVAATRSLVESAIESYVNAATGRNDSPGRTGPNRSSVARTIEQLGRWTGMGQGGTLSAPRRVRMAFSGEVKASDQERRRDKHASRDLKGRNDEEC